MLCHAVLVFDALAKFGSKADRVLFYPESWDLEITDSKDRDSQLLVMARDQYKVKLHPIKPLNVGGRQVCCTAPLLSLPRRAPFIPNID
jgi:hypothetical protein